MKKFNLEKARKGEIVITRSKKIVKNIVIVSQLQLFDTSKQSFLVGKINKKTCSWDIKGQRLNVKGKSSLDLFMKGEEDEKI